MKDNIPAFPEISIEIHNGKNGMYTSHSKSKRIEGMTLLDYFATHSGLNTVHAYSSLMEKQEPGVTHLLVRQDVLMEELARLNYVYAELMLKERAKYE